MKTIITIILSLSFIFLQANDPKKERKELLDLIFQTLETHIANPSWLEKESYQVFKEGMYAEKTLELSEDEFFRLFKRERKKLPFTHLALSRKNNESSDSEESNHVLSWKEIDPKTAYLDVMTFATEASPMVKALQEIGYDKYENLIIDLRNNGGGSLDAPVVLGQFLTNQPIDAGFYLTRKWYLTKQRPATIEDVPSFPFLQDFTYQGIAKMFQEEAAFRMVIPGHNRPTFKGKVYVLVNYNTASACEPLIDLFQKFDIATLVGSHSAGAMLSGRYFPLNETYDLFLPISDYQTAEGKVIDKVGVAPDVKIDPKEALEYVLEELIEKGE